MTFDPQFHNDVHNDTNTIMVSEIKIKKLKVIFYLAYHFYYSEYIDNIFIFYIIDTFCSILYVILEFLNIIFNFCETISYMCYINIELLDEHTIIGNIS